MYMDGTFVRYMQGFFFLTFWEEPVESSRILNMFS